MTTTTDPAWPWVWVTAAAMAYNAPQRGAFESGHWVYTAPDGRQWRSVGQRMAVRQPQPGDIKPAALPVIAREAWEAAGGVMVLDLALLVPVGAGRHAVIPTETGEPLAVASRDNLQWLRDLAAAHGYRTTDAAGWWRKAGRPWVARTPIDALTGWASYHEGGHWWPIQGERLARRSWDCQPIPARVVQTWLAAGGRIWEGHPEDLPFAERAAR